MKKVIIIGAGISGLTAGIFARQHGFDTEIYEMHNKFKEPVFEEQFNNPELYSVHSSVDIGLGVKCDLSMRDSSSIFKVEPFK